MKNFILQFGNKRSIAVLSVLGFMVIGCSPLQPVKSVNINTFAFEAKFDAAPVQTRALTIMVNTPIARSGFDTHQMVYIKRLYELDHYAQNQWVDSPARMLAPLLVQALESTAKYNAVLNMHSTASADLRLDTEIVRLQHEFLAQPSQVHLTVRAQLTYIPGEQVLATREFEVIEIAPSDDPYGGVIATNRAVQKILQQIAEFCAAEKISGTQNN